MSDATTARQRMIVAKLMIDMHRMIYQGTDGRFGTNADLILVVCAISVGTHSGQPMGATKIANYVGMPRASVLRKIAYLEENGWIVPTGRAKWVLREGVAADLAPTARSLVALVQQAAKAL